MGRLPFWTILGILSAFMLLLFFRDVWQTYTGQLTINEREMQGLSWLFLGGGGGYVFVRAVLTVIAELRARAQSPRS